MRTFFLYNEASGSTDSRRAVMMLCDKHRIPVDKYIAISEISWDDYVEDIRSGVLFIVSGGDGTMRAVAEKITGTASMLLPLPGGTFNHFVQDTGMPADTERILSCFTHQQVQTIDVAEVNGCIFLNNSNIGLYPMSLIDRKKEKAVYGKWLAAFLSFLDQIIRFKRYQLTVNDVRVTTPFVFIGNSRFTNEDTTLPMRLSLSDHTLTLACAPSQTRLQLVWHVLKTLFGSHARHPLAVKDRMALTYVDKIVIQGRKQSIDVSLDGELRKLSFPLTYIVRVYVLKLLVINCD